MPINPNRKNAGYRPTRNTDVGPNQQHFKSNYIEVLQRIVPEFYEDTEYALFGEEEDLQYNVLARLLSLASNLSSVIATPEATQASSFSSNHSLIPYFVPFNKLTDVSPQRFENHILRPLGKTFGSFENVSDFSSFVVATALPATHLNEVTTSFATDYSAIVDNTASSIGLVQEKLIEELGWLYLLNTNGLIEDATSIAPSSVLVSSLNEDLFYGKKVHDRIRGLRLS